MIRPGSRSRAVLKAFNDAKKPITVKQAQMRLEDQDYDDLGLLRAVVNSLCQSYYLERDQYYACQNCGCSELCFRITEQGKIYLNNEVLYDKSMENFGDAPRKQLRRNKKQIPRTDEGKPSRRRRNTGTERGDYGSLHGVDYS